MKTKNKCKYSLPWVGVCNKECLSNEEYCEEHIKYKCNICGDQATHGCGETYQFVCGIPLCDKCVCFCKRKRS